MPDAVPHDQPILTVQGATRIRTWVLLVTAALSMAAGMWVTVFRFTGSQVIPAEERMHELRADVDTLKLWRTAHVAGVRTSQQAYERNMWALQRMACAQLTAAQRDVAAVNCAQILSSAAPGAAEAIP